MDSVTLLLLILLAGVIILGVLVKIDERRTSREP